MLVMSYSDIVKIISHITDLMVLEGEERREGGGGEGGEATD